MAECRLFRTIIKHHIIELPIISSIQEKLEKRLVIIPAYLTTGLEFKNVIIPNAGRHIYLNSEIDKKLLYQEVAKLEGRDKEIIEYRYGLNGKKELTQKEVAVLMGISQSYISRIEKKVIKKLRTIIKL